MSLKILLAIVGATDAGSDIKSAIELAREKAMLICPFC